MELFYQVMSIALATALPRYIFSKRYKKVINHHWP